MFKVIPGVVFRSPVTKIIGAALCLASVFGPDLFAQGAPINGTAQVSVVPRVASVTVGQNFQADVIVNLTGVTGSGPSGTTPVVLGAYVIGVSFDSARLQYVSAGGGTTSEFSSSPTVNSSNASSGSISISAVQNSSSSPTGSVKVAVITFQGKAPGSASMNPVPQSLSSAYQPPSSGPAGVPHSSSSNQITVNAANQQPSVTNPGSQSDAEGDVISLPISASDPDPDTLNYSATGLPSGLSINALSGEIGGTIGFSAAASSPHNVQVTVTDGHGGSANTSFTWTVSNTNRPPTLTNPGPKSSTAGTSASVQLSGSDLDGDTLTYGATGLPPGLSVNTSTGLISGTINATAASGSPYTVNASVNDGNGGTQNASFSWAVSAPSCSTVGSTTITAPSQADSGQSFQVSWTAVSGATEYQLQKALDATFAGAETTVLPGGTTSVNITETVSSDTEFSFRVRARSVSGSCDVLGNYSPRAAVLVTPASTPGNPPGAASGPSPADGATGVVLPVTLSWRAGDDATSYRVYFGTSTSPSLVGTTSSTSFAITANQGTTHYWRVTAVNSADSTPGPLWSFSTAGATCPTPSTPVLNGPSDVVTNSSIDLSWSVSTEAAEYLLEQSLDAFETSTTVNVEAPTTTRSITASMPVGSLVSYRVRARSSSGNCQVNGEYSNVVTVLITALPVPAEVRIIPVVASTPGGFGSFFRTAVQLHNSTSDAMGGRIVFHRQGVTGTDADPSLAYSLDANETALIEDLVAGMGQSGLGSADLIATIGGVPLVVTRIFNDAGTSGTTGMTQPLLDPASALGAGEKAILIVPPDAVKARFNIGVRTLEAGATISVNVRDAEGALKKTSSRSYPPTFFVQTSVTDFLGELPDNNASIEIRVDAGTVMIYGATTDNITQDPSMQIPARQ